MGNILVTGAYGYVGNCLCEKLLEEDKFVVKAGRDNLDMTNPDSVLCFLQENKIEKVIHLAAVCETKEVGDYYSVNICGLYNFISACKTAQITHFTFASGNNVYPAKSENLHKEEEICEPDYRNNYGISKYIGELLIEDILGGCGIPYAILRIADIYGLGQRYGNLIKTYIAKGKCGENLQVYGRGIRTRDYIYVTDVVDGICFANENKLQGVYNLSTGVGTSINQLALMVSELSGKNNNIEYIDCEKEDDSCVVLSPKKLDMAGFTPKITIRQGLKRIIEESRR